jgi:hypothetical protein
VVAALLVPGEFGEGAADARPPVVAEGASLVRRTWAVAFGGAAAPAPRMAEGLAASAALRALATWRARRTAATESSFVLESTPPAATTSGWRRTRTSAGVRRPAMPPGVHVCSFGTLCTARGRPRRGRASPTADVEVPGESSGSHQRGGATAPPVGAFVRRACAAAVARRMSELVAAVDAKRCAALASRPIDPLRRRAIRGPGKRNRAAADLPSRVASSGVLTTNPASAI